MESRGPLLVLSDLHLGRGPCSAAALAPLLQGIETLILNGDSAELHLPGSEAKARDEFARVQAACAGAGVALTVLEGNHDLDISPLRHVLLAADRVLVTHGDAFDPCVAPWTPWAHEAKAAAERAIQAYKPTKRDSIEARFAAARAAAGCEWSDPQRALKHTGIAGMLFRPRAVFGVLNYWRRFPGLAAEFAAKFAARAKFVVCGHSHRPGWWTVNDRVILNTGHFEFPARPHAVLVKDGTISLWRLRIGERGYELAAAPRAAWPIDMAAFKASRSTPVSIPEAESR